MGKAKQCELFAAAPAEVSSEWHRVVLIVEDAGDGRVKMHVDGMPKRKHGPRLGRKKRAS